LARDLYVGRLQAVLPRYRAHFENDILSQPTVALQDDAALEW
jgi:hypothetical protein